MKKVLEDHCLGQGKKGLLLLSLPTGFGKTHAVLDFIFGHYGEFAERRSKIFFLTNLKKNLPDDALEERFRSAGRMEEYRRHVLRIPSTSGHVLEILPRLEDERGIPDEFRSKAFTELLGDVLYLREIAGQRLPSAQGRWKRYAADLEKTIRTEKEPAFRKEITKLLKERFPHKQARLEAVRENPRYSWIGVLYPAAFTDEKTVLFLSVDKFFLKNTPVVEPSYYFSHRLPDDSLVFIDEFDASKEAILKRIIQDGASHEINLIDLFLTVRNALAGNEFPEGLLRESEYRRRLVEEKSRPWPSVAEIAESFRTKSDRIFRKYSLHYAVKSGDGFSGQRNFLFHDYRFHHIVEGGGRCMEMQADRESRTNWLSLTSGPTGGTGGDGAGNVRFLLGELNGFFSYIQRGIGYMADNYRHLKAEGGAADEFTLDSAVRTVLAHLQTGEKETGFLAAKILETESRYTAPDGPSGGEIDGLYDRGFRLYNVVDSEDHDTCSRLSLYDYGRTPEAFLADLCGRAMVVGSSATASIPSALANFDLLYLESRLGDLFRRLGTDELDRLREAFERTTEGYGNLRILPEFIGAEGTEGTLDLLSRLYGDEEAVRHWMEKFSCAAAEKDENGEEKSSWYGPARYARALAAWKRFYDSPCCPAFLCLFSRLCKAGDPDFDLALLREAAAMLSGISAEEAENMMVLLSGDAFEEQKETILSDLSAGERRFVLSSYKTVGAGQNLQYQPPEGASLVSTGDGERSSGADWSGIYLDRPANLLVNIFQNGALTGEMFAWYIFQLEFLLQGGVLSPKTFRTKLRQAFARFTGGKLQQSRDDRINLYETPAYAQYVTAVVLQAVGRICRTSLKSPEILVLADEKLKDILAGCRLPDDVIPVREFAALKAAAGERDTSDERVTEMENRASHRSNVVWHRIVSFLNRARLEGGWSAEDAEEWRLIREQTLRSPFFARPDKCPARWAHLYARLPRPAASCHYKQDHDYADVEVFFTPGSGREEVSSRAARLPEIAAVPELRGFFGRNGWPLDFPRSELLLLPPVFNNIYKGALGEACGRFLFESEINIPLSDLGDAEYELFDFRTGEGIFVDFKLWSDRTAVPADWELEKIRRKMEQAKASKVFVVNIFGSPGVPFRPLSSSDGKVTEVPFLCRGGKICEEALFFLKEKIGR